MRRRITWILGGILFLGGMIRAEEPLPEKQKPTDDDLRIRGVFNSVLPKTEKKHSLRLIVHPHMGDLTKRDHIRLALGFRYGITSRWEATAEAETFFSHGLKDQSFFEESGISTVHLGTKYAIGDPFGLGWDTSVGIDWVEPQGSPPVDVTDGLRHVIPYITSSHRLEHAPAWRVFAGIGGDDVTWVTVGRELEKNELRFDSLKFSGGALFEHGSMTYALETIYSTTRFTSPVNLDVIAIRPSIVWVLPQKYTFGAKGKWLLGLGLRFTHGPEGNDFGVNAKLRVNFDFKRLLGRKKEAASGP